jgi:hypothetical protein
MLQIRPEQYEVLNKYARENFVKRVYQYFLDEWKKECRDMNQEELEGMIRKGIEAAESYDIEIEADVVKYLEICLQLGEEFSTSPDFPWAQDILLNQETDGTIKVEQLRNYTIQLLDDLAEMGE